MASLRAAARTAQRRGLAVHVSVTGPTAYLLRFSALGPLLSVLVVRLALASHFSHCPAWLTSRNQVDLIRRSRTGANEFYCKNLVELI